MKMIRLNNGLWVRSEDVISLQVSAPYGGVGDWRLDVMVRSPGAAIGYYLVTSFWKTEAEVDHAALAIVAQLNHA